MSMVDPESFLVDQFPKKYWPLIPSTLRTAYAAAKNLAAAEPILSVPSAKDNQGRIISWSVDLFIQRLIESGKLPFEFQWKQFSKPTGRYLQIRLPHSVVTISQVVDSKKQPRDVLFRENGRVNNQPYLDYPQFYDEVSIKGLPHLLLIHGHQDLNFSHLAVPYPQHHQGYSYKTPNLQKIPHEVPTIGPEVEDTDTDFDAMQLLKDDIERWRKDHGE